MTAAAVMSTSTTAAADVIDSATGSGLLTPYPKTRPILFLKASANTLAFSVCQYHTIGISIFKPYSPIYTFRLPTISTKSSLDITAAPDAAISYKM